MLVITGATGNVGSKLTDILLSQGQKVRVVGRGAEKLAAFATKGAEAAVGDMLDEAFLTKALTGADAVFAIIPPNLASEDYWSYQNRAGESVAAAIRKAGVKHVVNLSSQGAHLSEGTGPIRGLRAQEERLNRLNGVHVLHLRPTFFMENLLMQIDLIKKMGVMGSAVRGDVRFAMIATKDIAAYAADRLVKRDFTGKSVRDLLGQRDLSMYEAAEIIGKKIGKPDLKYIQFPYEEAEQGLVAAGLSRDMSRLYVEMSKALNEGLFSVGLPRTKENTTPTSFEEFSDTFAKLFALTRAA
jgi:uncharacterized protein YbjT (DUF2867 family)